MSVILLVMRDQLLWWFDPDGQNAIQVIDETCCMRSGLVEEIQSVVHILDFEHFIVGIMF